LCAEALSGQLAPAYSQIAIGQLYSSPEEFQKVQNSIAEIADNVQRGFTTILGEFLAFDVDYVTVKVEQS
jgi:hypothetical protein